MIQHGLPCHRCPSLERFLELLIIETCTYKILTVFVSDNVTVLIVVNLIIDRGVILYNNSFEFNKTLDVFSVVRTVFRFC